MTGAGFWERLFLQLLNMGLGGGAVILLVLLCRLALLRAPKRYAYALWALPLIRLLVPFTLQSAHSPLPLTAQPIPQDIALMQSPRVHTGVDALNGGPGVYSARFGGEGLDDKGRYTLLLEMLRGQTDRAAHFHTSIVCAFPNGDELVCEGECPGTIAFAPMGEGGFGYDPIFFVPELRKTFGQLTAEEKASVSHRGKALRAFAAALDDYLKGNE